MDFLGRKESKFVAGIAILMMMFHHFFGFSEWLNGNTYIESLTICDISIERMIAAFGKLCVALFAFSSGYVIWKSPEEYICVRKRINRIIKFLFNYWIVFALFLLYGLLVGDLLPKGVDFFYNLIGLRTCPTMEYVNVAFAWYVTFYVVLLLLSPLLLKIFVGNSLLKDFILYLIIVFLLGLIPSVLWRTILAPTSASVMGLLVAKWNVFDKLKNVYSKFSVWMFLVAILFVALIRQFLLLINVDLWGGRSLCGDIHIRNREYIKKIKMGLVGKSSYANGDI